jgi:hypothetical protein
VRTVHLAEILATTGPADGTAAEHGPGGTAG